MIGLTAELATAPVLPGGVVLRQVTADGDMHRIAALQSAVWGQDWNWLAGGLIDSICQSPLPGLGEPRRARRVALPSSTLVPAAR